MHWFAIALIGSFFSLLASPIQISAESAGKGNASNSEKQHIVASEASKDDSAGSVLFAKTGNFERDSVIQIARELARKPYVNSSDTLPAAISNLSYDEYRKIRFKPEYAFWKKEGLPFQLQLFHRGLYFQNKVEIAIVEGNKATHIPYNRDFFLTDESLNDKLETNDIGYSGFRVHFPLNTHEYFDELIEFQGATYFRALGKGNIYGLSARGLAINTAETGEEFPAFKAFWIEKPDKDSKQLVAYALMDSPSVTGAYRFSIRPDDNTTTDVEVVLFPRVELRKAELSPISSMYMFSLNGRLQIDDYRPEVHDSDGLSIYNGRGEKLWRPLANPKELQVSDFIDHDLAGFGLMQRARSFDDYQDLEAHYEKRPGLWVEPLGSWGGGAVELIEIPSPSEIHDNIVALWRPSHPIKAGNEFIYSYRLVWGDHPGPKGHSIYVRRTASGRADILQPTPKRLYVIDYEVLGDKPDKMPIPTVTSTNGKVNNVVIQHNPINHGYRLSFEFDPQDSKSSELRAELKTGLENRAEVWLFRYTQ